ASPHEATYFLRGGGRHARRPFFLASAGASNPGAVSQMVHILAEHLRRDQGDAALGDEEALAVLDRIDADLEARGQNAIAVDDAFPERDVAMHLDVGARQRTA